jgi:hypothetical protein
VSITGKGLWCGLAALVLCAIPGAAQEEKPEARLPPPPIPRDIQQAPALPPKAPDVRQPGETGFYIGILTWIPRGTPFMNRGRGAAFDDQSYIDLQGKPKLDRGVEVGMALGAHNTLRMNVMESRASGDVTATKDLQLWEQTYDSGEYLTTDYRLRAGYLSFDYLTWPYPVESRRFRLKTLWQLRYTAVRTGFDAPKKSLLDEFDQPLVDASGNLLSYAAKGEKWFLSPAFGLGVAYYAGRHFRVEANGSGYTWPRRNTLWDTDASANLRFGHFEFRVGAKAFHFKTSTKDDFYMRGTVASGFVGLRWYSQ